VVVVIEEDEVGGGEAVGFGEFGVFARDAGEANVHAVVAFERGAAEQGNGEPVWARLR
jgi:hypothetical protein